MGKDDFTYKSNRKFEVFPSCTLDIDYFKKLFSRLETANTENAAIEIGMLKKKEGQTEDEFIRFKENCKKLFRVTIHIYGKKGAYTLGESLTIFNNSDLPDSITRISFENFSKYKVSLKVDPMNKFQVNIDFSKPKVFDLISLPSYATPNKSYIDVSGESESWVLSTFTKIKESLDSRKNSRGWLHANNIYDVFLYFLFIPLSLRILYNVHHSLPPRFSEMSVFFKVACYIYFFIIALNIFRIIFNYVRWVFPNIELTSSLSKGAIKHRYYLGAILLAIIGASFYDVIKTLFFQ